jgi:hypothetical protein
MVDVGSNSVHLQIIDAEAGAPPLPMFGSKWRVRLAERVDGEGRIAAEGVAALALAPSGRLVTLTHQWAITKQHDLPAWKRLVGDDLAATGMSKPHWTAASYRSGAAIAMVTHR